MQKLLLVYYYTGNTPMAIKNFIPMATHSFPVPNTLDFNMLSSDFQLEKF